MVPHVFRHTGPSSDALEKQLGFGQIKARGKWGSDLSVRRYEKHGVILRQFSNMCLVYTWVPLSSTVPAAPSAPVPQHDPDKILLLDVDRQVVRQFNSFAVLHAGARHQGSYNCLQQLS